jgi:AAA+ ATPase superfamily predicted ATPase
MNTGFYEIFNHKLKKMKQELKSELEKAKTDRRKEWICHQIKATKELQKTAKEMEKHMGVLTCCPNCGCEL